LGQTALRDRAKFARNFVCHAATKNLFSERCRKLKRIAGDLLKATSRSFYLTLRVLPAAVRPQIGLAYLLARTTDTIADTDLVPLEQRLDALKRLRERIQGSSTAPLNFGELAKQQGSSAEAALLEKVEAGLTLLQTLSPADSNWSAPSSTPSPADRNWTCAGSPGRPPKKLSRWKPPPSSMTTRIVSPAASANSGRRYAVRICFRSCGWTTRNCWRTASGLARDCNW